MELSDNTDNWVIVDYRYVEDEKQLDFLVHDTGLGQEAREWNPFYVLYEDLQDRATDYIRATSKIFPEFFKEFAPPRTAPFREWFYKAICGIRRCILEGNHLKIMSLSPDSVAGCSKFTVKCQPLGIEDSLLSVCDVFAIDPSVVVDYARGNRTSRVTLRQELISLPSCYTEAEENCYSSHLDMISKLADDYKAFPGKSPLHSKAAVASLEAGHCSVDNDASEDGLFLADTESLESDPVVNQVSPLF